MKTEILTHEAIKADVAEYQKDRRDLLSEELFALFCPGILISILLGILFGTFFGIVIGIAVGGLCAIYPIRNLIHYLCAFKALSKQTRDALNGGYSIERVTLSNIAEETVYHPHLARKTVRSYTTFTCFYFGCQKWRLPNRTCYCWSKDFYMSPTGVYNTSVIGDEFYAVTLHNEGDICCIYNAKIFQLKE